MAKNLKFAIFNQIDGYTDNWTLSSLPENKGHEVDQQPRDQDACLEDTVGSEEGHKAGDTEDPHQEHGVERNYLPEQAPEVRSV